jgi:hypothetical protein
VILEVEEEWILERMRKADDQRPTISEIKFMWVGGSTLLDEKGNENILEELKLNYS